MSREEETKHTPEQKWQSLLAEIKTRIDAIDKETVDVGSGEPQWWLDMMNLRRWSPDNPFPGMKEIYHALTGKECKGRYALGMATSAVSRLKREHAEMLAALKPIVDCYGLGQSPEKFVEQVSGFIEEARAAIQKAQGV
jgi:phosphoglycolate phosphatase-like HAD superfamily hydrolase